MQRAQDIAKIPILGSGIGYRTELKEQIYENRHRIDFVEVVADHFVGDASRLRELQALCDIFPVVPHGLRLSIASPAIDRDYLRAIKRVSDASRSPYYSDHLAVTRGTGVEIGHLSPLWFTEASLEVAARNVDQVQDVLQKPLILENISYAFQLPGAQMSECEFLGRLVERTGCGVLLDLANLHVNATNHGFDPIAWLDALPLDAVVQLHLAGGYWHKGTLIDGHCSPVEDETWSLLEWLSSRIRIKACALEHDDRFPEDFSILLRQVRRARRSILDAVSE